MRSENGRRGWEAGIRCIAKQPAVAGRQSPPPPASRSFAYLAGYCLCLCLLAAGCQGPPKAGPRDSLANEQERQHQLFDSFKLPEKLGTVDNLGLQLPAVSPDGTQILFLRLDAPTVSPLTLLGSDAPGDTPAEGTLSIWLRPLKGTGGGRRLSSQRWAHSPIWSASGQAVAYAVNEPPGSRIVHVDLTTGRETVLGLPEAVNCLPRFDGDDRTLLFCGGPGPSGPFRVFRQVVSAGPPVPLTPEGQHCLLPVMSRDDGRVLCARADGNSLSWVQAGPAGVVDLAGPIGAAGAAALAVWAGITEPVSPDRASFAFYQEGADRICAFDVEGKRLARHRMGSIAACWLDHEFMALATPDGLFVVNAFTGVSLSLMSGSWIPARYVPASHALIVLGKGPTPSRLSIYQIVFEQQERKKA